MLVISDVFCYYKLFYKFFASPDYEGIYQGSEVIII
jgi:hypothetical protein